MTINCQKCNEPFETFQCHVKAGNSKGTLCPNCRPTREDRKKQVAVACAQCGAAFSVKESEHRNNKTGNFYCSQRCMGLWRTANWVGEAHHNFKSKIEVACAICGTKKLVHESRFKAYDSFLCSNVCRGAFNALRTGERDSRLTMQCAHCGAELRRYVTSYEHVFCDAACRGRWDAEHNKGDSNPNYRGGQEFPCFVCDRPVWVKPSQFDRERHYCSAICSDSVKELFAPRGERSGAWKGGKVSRICQICGTVFQVKQAEAERAACCYCSKQCAGLGKAAKTTPEMRAMWRINSSIGSQIWAALKGTKSGRAWNSLVGYTSAELARHLESLFWPGMSWDNFGLDGWAIDHIRPRWSFSFVSAEDPQFRECWRLDNLQPLWYLDNARKSGKLGFVRGQVVPYE